MEDDLYIESFYNHKVTPTSSLPLAREARPAASLSPEHSRLEQKTLSLWLLKEEIHKHFPDSFPLQKLLRQIEEGFASSHPETVVPLIDALEELVDVMDKFSLES